MTFSIVARSADGSSWGVAVASKYLAVGSAVPAAEAGVGALATQSMVNLGYRPQGLALLRSGLSASATLAALTAADDLREERQAGVVDADGGSASWTGAACYDWAGGRTGPGYAVQGNILTGAEVVEQMERAWLDADLDTSLARRLFAALEAGDAAGGDSRGRQSAALLVVDSAAGQGQGADVSIDLRVDDHTDPIGELGRLLTLGELYFGTPDPDDVLPLEGLLAEEVAGRLEALGHSSLQLWMDIENYESRFVEGGIDPIVLDRLREAAPNWSQPPPHGR
jgi:uncharacterized Ntn-hydrolase superfamily protein